MAIKRRKRRKSRTPVSRERTFTAAMNLADAKGLEALTMRSLAAALGVEAMSLYHHVANKDEILDGMVDLVFSEVALPSPHVDWKTAMRDRAHALRAALLRHRWAVGRLESRTTPGPATLQHHDAVLGCLRRSGFSLELTGHAYALLDSYIYGFVQQEIALPFQTSQETQTLVGQMMGGFPEGAYSNLVEFTVQRVLQPGYRFGNEFSFGLELILDGLEHIRSRVGSEP